MKLLGRGKAVDLRGELMLRQEDVRCVQREKERAGYREARGEQQSVSFVGTLISEREIFLAHVALSAGAETPGCLLKAQSMASSLAPYGPRVVCWVRAESRSIVSCS